MENNNQSSCTKNEDTVDNMKSNNNQFNHNNNNNNNNDQNKTQNNVNNNNKAALSSTQNSHKKKKTSRIDPTVPTQVAESIEFQDFLTKKKNKITATQSLIALAQKVELHWEFETERKRLLLVIKHCLGALQHSPDQDLLELGRLGEKIGTNLDLSLRHFLGLFLPFERKHTRGLMDHQFLINREDLVRQNPKLAELEESDKQCEKDDSVIRLVQKKLAIESEPQKQRNEENQKQRNEENQKQRNEENQKQKNEENQKQKNEENQKKCENKMELQFKNCPSTQASVDVKPPPKKRRLYVVLDNLRSAFNVGAIFRTSECLGVTKIFLCGYTQTPSSSETPSAAKAKKEAANVSRTTMATDHFVEWQHVQKTHEAIELLKRENVLIVGLETVKDQPNLFQADFAKFQERGVAIVLGNERYGLEADVLHLCDLIVNIPMAGVKNSLNVGVSFGVAGFEIVRQWDYLQFN